MQLPCARARSMPIAMASRVVRLAERTDDVLTTLTADDVPDSVEP